MSFRHLLESDVAVIYLFYLKQMHLFVLHCKGSKIPPTQS